MKISHTRCINYGSEAYSNTSLAAESPERFADNVKTFKPTILVGHGYGGNMSRNAIIESQADYNCSDTPLIGSPIRDSQAIGQFKHTSLNVS